MFFVVVNVQNECLDMVYKLLGDLVKRSLIYVQDSVFFCDRYFVLGWYGVLYYDMLIIVLDLWECGIMYFVWFNGNIIVVLMLIYFYLFFQICQYLSKL